METQRSNKEIYKLFTTAKTDKTTSSNVNVSLYSSFNNISNDVFHIEKNKVKLSDVVLPKNIEKEIQGVLFEHEDRDFFLSIGLLPTNKIMLYGDPGCGKTMLAYAIASTLGKELKIVNLSRLISSHLGETSNNLASIFSKYGSEKYILFIDEFDIIGRLRGDTNNEHNEMKRIVNTLLQLIDFFPENGFLVFATNDIGIIDKALLRRLDRVIEIPLPNQVSIKSFLKTYLRKYNKFLDKINYESLAKNFKNQSFSTIQHIIQKNIKTNLVDIRKNGKNELKITTADLAKM